MGILCCPGLISCVIMDWYSLLLAIVSLCLRELSGSLQTEQQDQQHHQQQTQPQQQQHQEELQQAQRIDVIAIATRADKLTPEECTEVEKAIRRGMKSFSQRLDLCFVKVVDARKSNSYSMNDLRRDFMHLVHRVLAVRFLLWPNLITFLCLECWSSSWSSSPPPLPPPQGCALQNRYAFNCFLVQCKMKISPLSRSILPCQYTDVDRKRRNTILVLYFYSHLRCPAEM